MRKNRGILLWVLLFVFLTTYNFDLSKWTEKLPLQIKKIEIFGLVNLDETEIQRELNPFYGESIVFFNIKKLREYLNKYDFIKDVTFKKIYPDTIRVIIVEYPPIGLFIKKNKKYVLIRNGQKADVDKFDKIDSLPIVKGLNADKHFHNFYNSIEAVNFDIKIIKEFNFFEINRWDIILKNGKVIKLPKKNYKKSLIKFISIYNRENINNFEVFDFRIDDQLILK